MRTRRHSCPLMLPAALLFTLLLAPGCGKDESIPTGSLARPDRLIKVGGDNQVGQPGTRLGQPFAVKVTDSDGNPVPSHKVRFEVTSPAGAIAGVNERSAEFVTSNGGVTSAYLLLGNDSTYTVTASATGASGDPLSGSPVIFNAFRSGGADTTGGGGGLDPTPTTGSYSIAGVNLGADTVGSVGRIFPIPFVVRVVDSLGQGVVGLDVFYSSPVGNGVFDIAEKATNQFGVASNQCRLGFEPGPVEVMASVVLPNGKVATTEWRVQARRDPDVRQNAWDIASVTSEDSIVGTVGRELPVPLVVTVSDTFGNGSPGQTVTWLVEEGSGALGFGQSSGVTSTNSEGLTQVNFTPGLTPGLNLVRATIIRTDGLPVSTFFEVWGALPAASDMADTILVVDGGDQRGEVNTLLPEPIVVRVLDYGGVPLPGVEVKFTIVGGGPQIGEESDRNPFENSSMTLTTDDLGQAAISMRMGPGPDLDMVVVAEVRRPDGEVITTTITAQALPNPDTANKLYIMSGNNQGYDGEYAVTSTMPLPLVVRVVDTTRTGVNDDTLGAPISNFPVLFQAFSPSGDAAVTANESQGPAGTGRLTSLTDEDGLAAIRLRTGSQTGGPDDLAILRDNNSVIAVAVFADGSQDTVVFRATAVPAAPNTVAASGPTELSATAGEALTGLGVTVSDRFANLVAGAGVSFNITQIPSGGSASLAAPTSVTTDINGNASVDISQVSTKVGEMRVAAASGTLNGSPVTFNITVNPGPASQLLLGGGDGQSSPAGTAYGNALKVLVYDQYNNPVEDVLVSYRVTGGSASLDNNTVATDADGAAESTCTPIAQGNITVEASASFAGGNATVTFNLTATAP